jgi:hypothetical protein
MMERFCCDGDCNQGRDCPARKEFDMNRLNLISICFITAIITAFAVAWFMATDQYLQQYDHGYSAGFDAGHKEGKRRALMPQETNYELQEVCLSIWIGNQIRDK